MKILIIDSHKGSDNVEPQNLHWKNAKILSDYLGADLIWSYPSVNNTIKPDYDIIIFIHASHYAYTEYEWVKQSPNAKLFYITNEYNLGEPRTLWMAAKEGRKYDVIANHPSAPSKIVMKYVNDWHFVNINSLIYSPAKYDETYKGFAGCVYYGSFRKDRSLYFKKYLNENVILSTHSKNIEKFKTAGATSKIGSRINWGKEGLSNFKASLYIEDIKTHTYYNCLANRFYESLNYDCLPIFSEESKGTVNKSGYNIPNDYFINSPEQIPERLSLPILKEWHLMAESEKEKTLKEIEMIVRK